MARTSISSLILVTTATSPYYTNCCLRSSGTNAFLFEVAPQEMHRIQKNVGWVMGYLKNYLKGKNINYCDGC